MVLKMYSDIIGDKVHAYDRYQVEYHTFISQMGFERVLLYVLHDTNGWSVSLNDEARFVVTWFDKRSEQWK